MKFPSSRISQSFINYMQFVSKFTTQIFNRFVTEITHKIVQNSLELAQLNFVIKSDINS